MKTSEFLVCPSQFTNVVWFIITLIGVFVHPFVGGCLFILLTWRVIDIITWNYKFYDNVIVERRGIFSVTEESVSYFRIKSIKLEKPFWMRIFGFSVVCMTTSEAYKPELKIYGVKNGNDLIKYISKKINLKRKKNGVGDVDLFHPKSLGY